MRYLPHGLLNFGATKVIQPRECDCLEHSPWDAYALIYPAWNASKSIPPLRHDTTPRTALEKMLENGELKLEDGRTLSYAIYGSPVPKRTAIFMHGFPSSRLEGRLWHSACAKQHIRLISPDRPGNGLSTFQHNRCILDWPTDVIALVDSLKVQQFYILGVSGGAPYALACIKSIRKERLVGVTIVSGLYPMKYGTASTILPSRILLWVAPWMTGLSTTLFDTMFGKASRKKDPKVFEDLLSKEIENQHVDDQKAIRDPAIWSTFVAMTRECFYQDSQGASWEARLNGSDWGFELKQLQVGDNETPLTLWHGTEDKNCPIAMTRKATRMMPGSILHEEAGERHVGLVFNNTETILENLLGVEEIEEYVRLY